MEDFKERFKRDFDRLSYMYAKANTKSKKRKIAYDLIFFEEMYNGLSEEIVDFPWTYDEDLIDIRLELVNNFIESGNKSFGFVYEVADTSFNIFLEEEFSIHKYYGKYYHKIDEQLVQKYIGMFFREIDSSLVERFKYKLENLELIINPNLNQYAGITFPIETINENIIFFEVQGDMCVDTARVLAHELGHDFEFDNAKKNGITGSWMRLSKTLFTEVSSCFFEYPFINYLLEHKIYMEDAEKAKGVYLYNLFYYLSHILIIDKITGSKVECDMSIKLGTDSVVEYANGLLEKMNVISELYDKEECLNFRDAFVYGIGRLLGIYIYDEFKNNPKEFLSNFRKMLLDYKDNGFNSLRYLNIDKEKLLNGDVFRKTLRLYNQGK